MRASTDLFDIIKSLSKAEKRYFRLFSTLQGGEKNYMRLFDAIEEQEAYDEAAIKERFADEPFVRQLNVAKKYLYDLILKSLLVHHATSSASARIREMLRSVELLHERGLSSQALKILERAIDLARERELHYLHAEGLRWLRKIDTTVLNDEEGIDRQFALEQDVVTALETELEYEKLYFRLASITHGGPVEDGEDLERITHIMSDPLLDSGRDERSLSARLVRLWTLSFNHYARGEYAEALACVRRQAEVMESNIAYLFDSADIYIRILNNWMNAARCIGDEEQAEEARRKLHEIGPVLLENNRIKNPRVRAEVFSATMQQRLADALAIGNFSGVLALENEVAEGIEENGPYLTAAIVPHLLHCMSWGYLGAGNHRRALDYNLRITDEYAEDIAPAAAPHVWILRLVIYFQMGDRDLLHSQARSIRRHLTRRYELGDIASMVLTFLASAGTASEEDLRRNADCLRRRVDAITEGRFGRNASRYFSYGDWLASIADRRSLRDATVSRIATETRLSRPDETAPRHPALTAVRRPATHAVRTGLRP